MVLSSRHGADLHIAAYTITIIQVIFRISKSFRCCTANFGRALAFSFSGLEKHFKLLRQLAEHKRENVKGLLFRKQQRISRSCVCYIPRAPTLIHRKARPPRTASLACRSSRARRRTVRPRTPLTRRCTPRSAPTDVLIFKSARTCTYPRRSSETAGF